MKTTTAMNVIIMNAREVGRKKFAAIPLTMCEVDDRYQRMDTASEKKINSLIKSFDINMMDAIKVSPHYETGKFFIIDGFHRFMAVSSLGEEFIEAEILIDLPQDPQERLLSEAKLFSDQSDILEKVTPAQKHNAYIIQGKEANVALDKLMKKYEIDMPGKGKKIGTLTGFMEALRIAGQNGGIAFVDDVFSIICGARWNLIFGGLGNNTIRSLYNVLKLHPDRREDIIRTLQMDGKVKTIKEFKADGASTYPTRTTLEQTTLALEDYLHDAIGLDLLYLPEARTQLSIVA